MVCVVEGEVQLRHGVHVQVVVFALFDAVWHRSVWWPLAQLHCRSAVRVQSRLVMVPLPQTVQLAQSSSPILPFQV